MYQIKMQNGYSLECIGKGNGLTRISNSQNEIVYTGSYNDCVQWLSDRGIGTAGRGGKLTKV